MKAMTSPTCVHFVTLKIITATKTLTERAKTRKSYECPPRAEIKNAYRCTSTPYLRLHGAVRS